VVVYIFGVDTLFFLSNEGLFYGKWLMYAAGFTVIAASCMALSHNNLKKRLAYSTVSQLSYVLLALSLFSPKGLVAASFHIAAHAFGKITLFFAAGSIYTVTKKKYVSELDGIGRQMPWTMAAFSIGAVSMIGIPPAAGFITKWYMLSGAFIADEPFILAVIVLSTLLNAMYFLPIIMRAFFHEEVKVENTKRSKPKGEAPLLMVIALGITATATLWLCFSPDIFLSLATQVGTTE
jgi:multicomponent Na+:H+ antiporter subunit D